MDEDRRVLAMSAEDIIIGSASSNSDGGAVKTYHCQRVSDVFEASSLSQTVMGTSIEKDVATDTRSVLHGFDLNEPLSVMDGCRDVQDENSSRNLKKDGTCLSKRKGESSSAVPGVKKPRIIVEEQLPSVQIIYNSLTKDSKQKLVELLQQWSQWHAHNCSSSKDSDVILESGKETYFPALQISADKSTFMTFWVDDQIKNEPGKEQIPLDSASIPLYDRGYSLALTSSDGLCSPSTVENVDTSRCFNCGSYSHELKDCPKPRDNAAINKAWEQHKSKRKPHSRVGNSRYYQSSSGGRHDGLVPGVLEAETRKLLGLGDLDPPPWLNRMREIGYPPGYLETDDEDDQPSGITIFGEETGKKEAEEGRIRDLNCRMASSSRKMSYKFPGINAPIPENAKERLWAASSSSSTPARDHPLQRYDATPQDFNHWERRNCLNFEGDAHPASEPATWKHRFRYNCDRTSPDFSSWNHDRRMQHRDFEADGPLGCEPGPSFHMSDHFHRYSEYHYSYYPMVGHDMPSTHEWSPSFGRSWSDEGRRRYWPDDFLSHCQYGTPEYLFRW